MLEKIEVVIAHRSTRCIAAARAAIDARCLRQTAAPGTAAHAPAPDRTGCASPRGAGIGSGYAPKARTGPAVAVYRTDRKSTRQLQSLMRISYAVFCLKKKKNPLSTMISNKTIISKQKRSN